MLTLLFNGELISNLIRATDDRFRLGSNTLLLLLGMNGALQRHRSVFRDDLDVVPIGRQRFVSDQGLTDFFSEYSVRSCFRLLVCRIVLSLVSARIIGTSIWWWREPLVLASRRDGRQ